MIALSPILHLRPLRSGAFHELRRSVGRRVLALSIALLAVACDSDSGRSESAILAAEPKASPEQNGGGENPSAGITIFVAGTTDQAILIGDVKGARVQAIACQGGRVINAGALSELRAKYKSPGSRAPAREVSLKGFAVPGLQDAHVDMVHLGAVLLSSSEGGDLDLREASSFSDLCERVAAAVEGLERGRWLVGYGWDDANWPEDLCATEFESSKLTLSSPNHPVALWSREGARLLANHRALASARLVGPDARRPRPVGGEVIRNLDGDATGVLLDSATELVASRLDAAVPPALRERILAAQSYLISLGLTGVHDIGAEQETIAAYRELDAEGELQLRVTAYLDGTQKLEATDLEGLPLASQPGGRLAVPGIVYRIDGALVAHGAALLEPYTDRPREDGRLLLETKDLRDRIAQCVKAGLQPALEPIGDRAARMALDVFQELKSAMPGAMALRPRLEEAQIVVPKDWPRFPDLGVLASIQPARLAPGFSNSGSRRAQIERLLGGRRTGGVFAWRRVAPELGVLAFGSDAPAETANPLLGLWAARRTEENSGGAEPSGSLATGGGLSGEEALAGYTTGPAFAAHQESFRGRLLQGYDADFTVLDIDPVLAPASELLNAKVLLVVIGGDIVWRAGDTSTPK